MEDEILSEKHWNFPCLYDKPYKSYKEKDVIKNVRKAVAEELDSIEYGRY